MNCTRMELIQTVTDASALVDRAIELVDDIRPRPRNFTRIRLSAAKRYCDQAIRHLDDEAAGGRTSGHGSGVDIVSGESRPPASRRGLAWVKRWFAQGANRD